MLEVSNFHQLKALDIDKKEVDFKSLNGKVRRDMLRNYDMGHQPRFAWPFG